MGGKPSRVTARAMNSPSRDSEIKTRLGFFFSTRRQTTPWMIRPCQKQATIPSGLATAAFAASRFSKRQRMLARVAPM